ncbi:MAG: choice-of-anchor D domain-containing protein [Gammaproteobacteria bacterium]|nr:choice-of-anchor D domain-containing protein [Gammaproteobacteria bacterium]
MDQAKSVTATFALKKFALTVTKAGDGFGDVTSKPQSLTCRAACSEAKTDFVINTTVVLEAQQQDGSQFMGWSGCDSTSGNSCTVSMTAAKSVTATFKKVFPLLVTTKGSGGVVSSTPAGVNCGTECSPAYVSGTVITLKATPSNTWRFKGWTGCDAVAEDVCTVTMTAAKNVTATFEQIVYPLTVTKAGDGSGSVTSDPVGINCGTTCRNEYTIGTSVTLTATAATGSVFSRWTGCASVAIKGNTCEVTMDQAKSVTAAFAVEAFTLKVTKVGAGAGTVTSSPTGIDCGQSCSASFDSGTSVTLTATAANDSTFAGWSGACTGAMSCTVTMDQTTTVVATFNPPTPKVSVSPESITFNNQVVNATSGSSEIRVSNTGNAPLIVSGVNVIGEDAGDFTQSNNCSSVPAGGSCTISAKFKPVSAGIKSARISISHNAVNSPTNIVLNGTGTAAEGPGISVSPVNVDFGSRAINSSSEAQLITIRNTGTTALVITSVTVTDLAQFPGSQSCTIASVAPNQTCSIQVSFKPASIGKKSSTISISHNASGSPSSVQLVGTGTDPDLSMSDLSLTLSILGFSESKTSGTVSASSSSGASVTYSIQTQGAYGLATINSATGAVTYTIANLPSSATATSDRVVVKATAGSDSVTAAVNISLRYDPLLPNQWHLRNTGQNSFSSLPPTAGNDINVAGAWAAGLSGRGVKVAVVDSGLEIGHEDLSDNVDVSKSLNLVNGSNNPSSTGAYDHGTQVAGIIAASAFNNKGGRGVAYGARLRGYNLLADGANTLDNKSKALGGDSVSSDNDVFNQSFGIGANSVNKSLQPFNNFDGEINYNITTLRGGRGALGVQSAGNEFEDQRGDRSTCAYANQFGISCGHVATDTRRASTYPIIVGAMAADGKKSSYSTTGASIWIAAPGGEYGWSASYVSSSNLNRFKPAIVTTTSSGCSNYSQAFNALDSRGANSLSAQCQYTAKMNGTSAAAPVVSGVVALMLEANPQLTWRDVKHILANTATVVDASFQPISYTGLLSSGPLTLEQGWVRNSAGYYFHNWYGFGQVNAAQAVAMAKDYKTSLPPRKDGPIFTLRATQNIVIPPQSSYSFTANFTSGLNVIEGVVLFMNFDTPAVFCNQIEVTSPSGTKSILLNAAAGFTQTGVREVRLASNAFYGESPVGVWRVTYHNICSAALANTVLPTGSDQTLLFVGY